MLSAKTHCVLSRHLVRRSLLIPLSPIHEENWDKVLVLIPQHDVLWKYTGPTASICFERVRGVIQIDSVHCKTVPEWMPYLSPI